MTSPLLSSFLHQFMPSNPIVQELSAVNGQITSLTIRENKSLRLHCKTERPISPDLLCRTEEMLEQALPADEVLICQVYPQKLTLQAASSYAAQLAPWFLRHVWKRDPMAASLLVKGQFIAGDDCVFIHLDDASRAFLPDACLNQLEEFYTEHISAATRFILAPSENQKAEFSLFNYAQKLHKEQTQKARKVYQKSVLNSQAHPIDKRGCFRQNDGLWGRIHKDLKRSRIVDLNSETGMALIEGFVFDLEIRPVSEGTRILCKFDVTDLTSSISCLLFSKPAEQSFLESVLDEGYVRLAAEISFDSQYSKDLQARVIGLQKADPEPLLRDEEPVKRIELHAHTKMSAKDAVCSATELVKRAAFFGHPAVAITDHGVVQAFPEAAEAREALKREGKTIKVIYGMEGYLVDDGPAVSWQCEEATLEDGFVALDVETTGLHPASDRLLEVAAVHFIPDGLGGFKPGDRFSRFVNPGIVPSPEIEKLTGIHAALIADAPEPLSVLSELSAFMKERPVIAHNALFDLGFLRYEGQRTKSEADPTLKFNPPLIDTLALSRLMLPDLANHKLSTVARHLGIPMDQAHRAEADALACGSIFSTLWKKSGASCFSDLDRLSGRLDKKALLDHKLPVYHIILLAADRLGLYNLYRLVSLSHLQYFHMRPRIPRSLLQYFRHGLVIGSACEAGEWYRTVLSLYRANQKSVPATQKALEHSSIQLGRFYDYFEIQPIENNLFYLRDPESGLDSREDLQNINRIICQFGKKLKKPVCATSDVHFLDEKDAVLRSILLTDQGYEDADQSADLHFRTTEEMLKAFAYLGEEQARKVVIDDPRKISSLISPDLKPFPDGSFPPIINQAADDIGQITWERAETLYGKDGKIPEIVRQRIESELKSIIKNGFAVMYYIAHKLVKKSNEDGYIVGSRGSVGSSLVATLCGITEVNPLPPHYLCPSCRYSAFEETGTYGSGYDLPEKMCPCCGALLRREGQDIPFETFLGFNGDKQPDIDLNFSGEYQAQAHQYLEDMFGSKQTFRAGTIASYAEKNAEAIVRKYFETTGQPVTRAEIKRLSRGIIGVKRTTGQHPGGIVVVPGEREIYDFTPVQYPADKSNHGTITTHFDFNAMHDTILKLDVLGHDDPTMLKMLSDLTGVSIASIKIPDERVMSLFLSTEALGIPESQTPDDCATLGLPEMGTWMARDMIKKTRPTRFYDLVQLMGLSHGTGVWKGNAQELIESGTCTINEVIGCRDSIMTGLIYHGLSSEEAFSIMEQVRKGKGLTKDQEDLMRRHRLTDWYIESCKKIKYLFPKAHAVAYTLSALRIAWFKVYYPQAYYCAYFTVRADEFDSSFMCQPKDSIQKTREQMRRELKKSGDREQRIYYILEVIEEMQLRGIHFAPIDLDQSDATRFLPLGKDRILPPLNTIPSISATTAGQIVKAREERPFMSRDDLVHRAGISRSVLDNLSASGCLDHLPDSSQIDLFELMN